MFKNKIVLNELPFSTLFYLLEYNIKIDIVNFVNNF